MSIDVETNRRIRAGRPVSLKMTDTRPSIDASQTSDPQIVIKAIGFTGCGAALFAAVLSFIVFDPTLAVVSCLLCAAMVAIAVSDARHFIVPDVLSLPAIPAGIIVNRFLVEADGQPYVVLEHLAAMALAGVFFSFVRWGYRRHRGWHGLGLGDVKLVMVAGAWTGIEGVLNVVLLASLSAIIVVVGQRLFASKAVTLSTKLAFGSFLAPAIWIVWFASQDPARSFMSLSF